MERSGFSSVQFPLATARVFREPHARWVEGGLPLLEASLETEPTGRLEAIFVAALGLSDDDLVEGIDRLARAAPALEMARQRTVLAALELMTGKPSANDPVRFLAWWETDGRFLSVDELRRRSGLRTEEANRLHLGIGPQGT